jgi:acyl carrier protein
MAHEKSNLERITDIITDQLGLDPSDVTPEAKIIEDLGADSLDAVELVMAVEEEFDIEISDEEAKDLKTVKDILDHVKKAQA